MPVPLVVTAGALSAASVSHSAGAGMHGTVCGLVRQGHMLAGIAGVHQAELIQRAALSRFIFITVEDMRADLCDQNFPNAALGCDNKIQAGKRYGTPPLPPPPVVVAAAPDCGCTRCVLPPPPPPPRRTLPGKLLPLLGPAPKSLPPVDMRAEAGALGGTLTLSPVL